ncbi:MAG: TIGR04086 family membrane protein [Ruminiclostridium sp.]|nr:TIGR04086 family membrane protein [Ruminiclostridium sp.]
MQEKTGGQSAAAKAGYGIASALLMAFCITIPVMLVLAAVLTFTDFPEKYTTIGVVLATLSGLFAAGFRAGMGNEKNGMLRGGLTGLAYMVILYLVSSICFKDFTLSQRAIIMIITGLLAGAVGGLLGGNRKAKPFSRLNSFGGKSDSFRKYMK